MIKDFTFSGPKLDDFDFPRIGHQIGVGEDVIHGVLDVEAAGKSTDSKGRTKMLFEPHVFYRNLSGAKRDRAVKAGLAYAKWGQKPYPRDSYPRFLKACEIDETAAFKACSWGFPQVLGENHALAGFDTPQAMVKAMLSNEDEQLQAMINFIKNAGLDDELRVIEAKLKRGQKITADDCRAFVRGYNGPGYAKNDYHTKLARAVNKWAKIPDTVWSPEMDPQFGAEPVNDPVQPAEKFGPEIYNGNKWPVVESVQEQLDKLGYPEVGAFDGRWGSKTRAAVLAFRADNGLPITPTIDEALLAALLLAEPRPVATERKNATVADLREEGAEDVQAADVTQVAGGVATVGGVVTAADKTGLLDYLSDLSSVTERIGTALAPFKEIVVDNFWLLLLGVGGVVVWQSGVLKKIRLRKHQTGNDVSV